MVILAILPFEAKGDQWQVALALFETMQRHESSSHRHVGLVVFDGCFGILVLDVKSIIIVASSVSRLNLLCCFFSQHVNFSKHCSSHQA